MKKIWLLIVFVSVLLSCSDSNNSNKNPYIPNYSINLSINRSLPAYSVLTYPGNGVLVPGYGAKGIIIFSNGIDTYNAFDAACPNQAISSCSTLTIKDMNAICPCDNTAYNLYTGLGGKEYPLKQYRVELIGNVIHVYN